MIGKATQRFELMKQTNKQFLSDYDYTITFVAHILFFFLETLFTSGGTIDGDKEIQSSYHVRAKKHIFVSICTGAAIGRLDNTKNQDGQRLSILAVSKCAAVLVINNNSIDNL